MISLPRRRFTVDEYYCMAKAGILHEDDRIELIEGDIIEMSPIGSRHAGCIKFLNEWFVVRLTGRVIVGVQDPLQLSDQSQPEPDIMLLRPRPDSYRASHPRPEDVLLIIEVADTSLEYDRDVKLTLYARAGIPEAWLADLNGTRVYVCREPSPEGYRQIRVVEPGGVLTPLAFPDRAMPCECLLG